MAQEQSDNKIKNAVHPTPPATLATSTPPDATDARCVEPFIRPGSR